MNAKKPAAAHDARLPVNALHHLHAALSALHGNVKDGAGESVEPKLSHAEQLTAIEELVDKVYGVKVSYLPPE